MCFRYDWLQIHDGSNTEAPLIKRGDKNDGEKLCGKTVPDLIFPSENELYLEFKSDSSKSFSGYKFIVQQSGKTMILMSTSYKRHIYYLNDKWFLNLFP